MERIAGVKGPVRAVIAGIAVIAAALAAWAISAGSGTDLHRVPEAPVFRATPDESSPPAPQTAQNVAVADADGGTSLDVSASTSANAGPSKVDASAAIDQSTDVATDGTDSSGVTQAEQHTVVEHSDGHSSVSQRVEINQSTSRTSVSSSAHTSNSSSTQVVKRSRSSTSTSG